jgi:hypothetical protein
MIAAIRRQAAKPSINPAMISQAIEKRLLVGASNGYQKILR